MEGRAFISNQLACVLHPLAFKTLFYINSWNKPQKYYPKNLSKVLHIDVSELDSAIQSLVDHKLLDVSNVDGKFVLEVEKEELEKYVKIPMERVLTHQGYSLPTEITWNKLEVMPKKIDDLEGLSPKEISQLIMRLQATLNEKKQVKELVTSSSSSNDDADGLPF